MAAPEKMAFVVTVLFVSLAMLMVPWSNMGYVFDIDLEKLGIEDFNITQSHLDVAKDIYNQNIDSVPEVRDMLANERINLHIEGVGTFSIVNKDGEMQSIEEGEMADPTLNVNTDTETVMDVMSGKKQPADTIKDGSLSFAGVGLFNWLRFEIVRIFIGIAAALGML